MSAEVSITDKHPAGGMTPEQILLTLGVMGYSPMYYRRTPFSTMYAFDNIMTLAVTRGFPRRDRQLLKGNVRAAQVKGVALERASAVLALVTEEELRRELLKVDNWYRMLDLAFTQMRTRSSL